MYTKFQVASELQLAVAAKGESLKTISEQVGISYDWLRRAVSQGLAHRTKATDKHLLPLCAYLGVDPDELFRQQKWEWTVEDFKEVMKRDYPHHFWLCKFFIDRSGDPQAWKDYFTRQIEERKRTMEEHGPVRLDRFAQSYVKWLERSFDIGFTL